jgi:tetratricopeptide (TPR) repeat protein
VAVGWGLNSWYGSGDYYNPYYTETPTAAYDYSQPVVVNNYASAGDSASPAAAPAPEPPENQQAMKLFDQGMAAFKAGQYADALASYDASLKLLPGDPVLHEVRALTLFALGRYQEAAAVLDSLLASAPGMDWTTLTSLYGNVDDYTAQLRALEEHCRDNRNDAAAAFVLAYQYLVMGHNDRAIGALKVVVKLQPKDATAQKMLKALAPEGASETPTPPPEAAPADGPQTDLVGAWLAKAGKSSIELTITEDSQFTWQATTEGEPPVKLDGKLTATSDLLVLETATQGSMVGQVKSDGADKFQFVMTGGPPGDAGLQFERQP